MPFYKTEDMEEINEYMPLSHDWNKERLETLKTMFPDLFTNEGQLNTDELKKLVDPESINETERYEFRWFGKSQAKRQAFTPSNATLVYDEKRSVNPDKSENLIIEGENLEVLKLLSNSYREKIKCIYIDPPYNTGKDFVYSDNFTQNKKAYWEDAGIMEEGLKVDTNSETDGRYHSNWLNMMYSRLLVARQLLKEDGVIFISIDDNEVQNLRKLCDEVFGIENFVSEFIWKSRQNKDNRTNTGASIDHEYVMCYSKNSENKALRGSDRKVEQYSNPDSDSRGDWASGNMVGILPENLRPNCHYDLINPYTGINYGKPKMGWRYDKTTMGKLISENRILWPSSIDGRPRRKVFLSELSESFTGFSSLIGENIYTRDGTKEIDELFEKRIFDFPKPSNLIKELIDQVLSDNEYFLDFFAGSGASGQALLGLNLQDMGSRKFILIQIPELTDEKSEAYNLGFKKISDITIERNKRVIERALEDQKSQTLNIFKEEQNDIGLGFKVFKLTKSKFPRTEWTPDTEKSEVENVEALKKYIAEKEAQLITVFDHDDLMTEILLKRGFNLNYITIKEALFSHNNVFLATDTEKEALVCLDAIMNETTVEQLKAVADKKFICLERALDTTQKWNLKHYLGDRLFAF